jgi:hypothetical protein
MSHLNGFAVAEGVDIRYTPFAPFHLVFQSHSHRSEHNDLVAGDNESFRLATSFGPSTARLRQGAFTLACP